MSHWLRAFLLLLLGLVPVVSQATTVFVEVPELLGDYLEPGDSRVGFPFIDPGAPGVYELELHLTVTSLCADPACDVRLGGTAPWRSGPLRGTSEVVLTLGGFGLGGASRLPIRLALGLPRSADEECEGSGRRPCESNGSVTYNGFWGASAEGLTLESPARVTSASIIVRTVPEPSALVCLVGSVVGLRRLGNRSSRDPA